MRIHDLAVRVAHKYDIDEIFCEDVLKWYIDEITDALTKKERVVLTNFCTFDVKDVKPRNALNFKTGEVEEMPATVKVTAKISNALKEAVKNT